MVRRVENSRRKEVSRAISITGFNNKITQKENFEEIIHDKTSPEHVSINERKFPFMIVYLHEGKPQDS
jgi:hypothetical protein